MEYSVTEENLHSFRTVAQYPDAGFPHLALAEFRQVLAAKYGDIPLTSHRHQEWYYHPPYVGRRVQVSGWIRDIFQQDGREFLDVGTFAVDEIGTEITRSRHTFLVGDRIDPQGEIPTPKGGESEWSGPEKRISREQVQEFRGLASRFTPQCHWEMDEPTAARLLAFASLHQLINERYSIDFRQGGYLDVLFNSSIFLDNLLRPQGAQVEEHSQAGVVSSTLAVWLEDQDGDTVSAGRAEVTVPSPLT